MLKLGPLRICSRLQFFPKKNCWSWIQYSDVGLNINNQNIDEFGITFGAGLPLGGTFSNANIGFEFGERGTTDADLIKEKYFNLHLSLSLNSRWFQKRKYN